MIQKLITKYENLSKALEGFETKELVDNFLADLHKLKSKDGKLPIPHVSNSLPTEGKKCILDCCARPFADDCNGCFYWQ